MKKLTLIFLTALSVGGLQACKSNGSGSKSDSSASITDTSSKLPADTAFATKAAIGGMAEVALGKLALSKTSDTEIKKFAQMMVTDHGKANDELMGIAKTKNILLPATVDAEHQKKLDNLSKLSGTKFNKAYVDAMLEGHKKVLELMQNEASNGNDTELKAFANKTALVVKMHLDAIQKIHDSMK